jgi:hypothetical protein
MIACLLFTLMSAGALAIVVLLPLFWQFKLLLSFTIVVSAIYTGFCHCLRLLPWSIVMLKINSKNQLQLMRKDGKQLEVTVLENTTVTPYLTVLNCHLKEATFLQHLVSQTIVILPDAVDAGTYRLLRVWLRWAKL